MGKVAQIAQSLKSKNYGKIDPETILKCLAALNCSSIRQDQIINLRSLTKEQMAQLVENTRQALMRARGYSGD